MIVTLSGASGVGKTTITGELLKRLNNASIVRSTTTRQSRATDLPGEYSYVSRQEFDQLIASRSFIWFVDVHDTSHGTPYKDIDETADRPNSLFFMILVPQVMVRLRKYCQEKKIRIVSFYILSPGESILESRLRNRGDSLESIRKRMSDCCNWDFQFRKTDLFEFFVANDGDLEEAVSSIEGGIKAIHNPR